MISRSGVQAIRMYEYTVGPIDPDPDDEHLFLLETAQRAFASNDLDMLTDVVVRGATRASLERIGAARD